MCAIDFEAFSFQSSQMRDIFTFAEFVTFVCCCAASAFSALHRYWFFFVSLTRPLFLCTITFFALMRSQQSLFRSLNSEYTIINLSPTMHKIHTFARSKSVNNNQLFLFVAAALAKVSFACLRSALFSIECAFLSLIQRTFKLGIEVFEGAGTSESIQKRSHRFYFSQPNSQCR